MDYSERLKQARIAKGMSQTELAKKVGISRAAICRYENGGRKKIAMPIVISIAKALDVDLFEEIDFDEAITMPNEEYDALMNASSEIQHARTYKERREELTERLMTAFYQLNSHGQYEAVKRIIELSQLHEYALPKKEDE